MSVSNILKKAQNKKYKFKNSYEYVYYMKNRNILKKVPKFSFFENVETTYQLICANIIITSLLNKTKIDDICQDLFSSIYLKSKLTNEEFLNYYHARIVDLKYLMSNDIKVYLPIISRTLNLVYFEQPFKLLEPPYDILLGNFKTNIVDPFDTYKTDLFDSFFTKLVKVKSYNDDTVFYHFDTQTMLFINAQGRLDYSLQLFDRYMEKVDTSHLLDRIIPVADAFYNNDHESFINSLYTNELISERLFNKIKKEENK